MLHVEMVFFFFKKKTAYEMRISDWSSDVCSSDLAASPLFERAMIWGKPFRFEDMGRLFLQRLIAHAGGALDERPRRIIVGRPVEYAGARPDPELARQR